MVENPSCTRMLATSASTSSCCMNVSRSASASLSLFASACDSLITLSSQPVSSEARRIFWPPRPIACESFSSDTAISIECESSSTTIEVTSAGAMALMTNCALLSSNGMMSTRSPAISLDTACTREPRMPTHAPTGSTRGSLLRTAIFARTPASRAAARMLIRPWPTSGTSSLNNSIKNSGAVRDRNNCGPRGSVRTSFKYALMRSWERTGSRGIISSRAMNPSALAPRSTYTPLRSTRLTMPLTNVPARSLYASTTWARSASRTFCTMTCLAVCARIRPKGTDSIGCSTKPPGSTSLSMSRASSKRSSRSGTSSSVESSAKTFQRRKVSYAPVLRLIETRTSSSSPCFFRVADANAASSASKMISLSTPFSLETASTAIKISLFMVLLDSSSLRPQSRLLNPLERQAVRVAVDLHDNCVVRNRSQYPDIPPPSIDRQLQLGENAFADEPLEVRASPQDPIESRRRDFQRVMSLDRILDLEHLAHRVTHTRTILDRNAYARILGAAIDEYPQDTAVALARKFDVDQLKSERLDRRL